MSDHSSKGIAQVVGAAANPIVVKVWQLAEPLCSAEGMQLVHVEFQRERGGRTLRLYLDKQEGVTLDDCAAISRQLGDILDVGLDSQAPYRLEVSSPGANRPLGRRRDFEQNKGKRIKIRSAVPLEGRTNFTGILSDISSLTVQLTVGKKAVDIQFADIVKANLVE
jgi:ribosome maturation factor RimP